jgi:putative Mn2+ efflux pump MntP
MILAVYALTGAVGLMLVKFAQRGLIPPGFVYAGSVLLVCLGLRFVVMGLRKKVDLDVALMRFQPDRWNFDRRWFERFGPTYFAVRNVAIGVVFLLLGITAIAQTMLSPR